MMRRWLALAIPFTALAGVFGLAILPGPTTAQSALDPRFADAPEAQRALERAQRRSSQAQKRAAIFEARAASATQASAKAQAEAAALAARVQQAEARIGVAEAELALVQSERRRLDLRLAERREPIVRLTGALQMLVRRPLSLSVLAPGSLRDTVYLGAVLDSTVPLVREGTAELRAELDRSVALQNEARAALAERRRAERALAERRTELIAMAQRERLAAERARGAANREELRALALGEQARDLDGLVERLEDIGSLRDRLAALPGPILRPADPGARSAITQSLPDAPSPTPSATAPPADYRLPTDGRLIAAFGSTNGEGARATGLSLVPRVGAQVVAPGTGRVVFAGPYRGFGRIVIIQHANGWTSLITGLGDLVARVGQDVVAGSPLGSAGTSDPTVTLELRRGGTPVNPLDHIG
jgi:septal ring factor EnvC (AmiA/AmiB activator)